VATTISPSAFLSKCESRLRDERASKDPENTSLAHAVSGNSLHNFVLENLLVYNEIAGVGRTPWRSIGERNGVGILRLALPFRKLRVVLAQDDRGILYSVKLRHYENAGKIALSKQKDYTAKTGEFMVSFRVSDD